MKRPMVNVYEGDPPELVYRPMTDAELAQYEGDVAAAAERASELELELEHEVELRDRAGGAIDTLEQAVASWSSLTAAQKDAAAKLSLRVVVALARLALRRFEAAP